MTDTSTPPAPTTPSGFQEIADRFLSFDKLIGSALIKFLYYAGLVGIGLGSLIILIGALAAGRYNAGALLSGVFLAAIVAVVGAVVWRFTCELWLLFFQIYNRLGEIRDRLPPP
jgi:hypothetical protein